MPVFCILEFFITFYTRAPQFVHNFSTICISGLLLPLTFSVTLKPVHGFSSLSSPFSPACRPTADFNRRTRVFHKGCGVLFETLCFAETTVRTSQTAKRNDRPCVRNSGRSLNTLKHEWGRTFNHMVFFKFLPTSHEKTLSSVLFAAFDTMTVRGNKSRPAELSRFSGPSIPQQQIGCGFAGHSVVTAIDRNNSVTTTILLKIPYITVSYELY